MVHCDSTRQRSLMAAHSSGYIAVFSSGAQNASDPTFLSQLDAIKKANLKFYWTGAGDIDQAHDRTVALEAALKAKGFPTLL